MSRPLTRKKACSKSISLSTHLRPPGEAILGQLCYRSVQGKLQTCEFVRDEEHKIKKEKKLLKILKSALVFLSEDRRRECRHRHYGAFTND